MTIEQNLMRSMKSLGGLTRGRGLTDSVLTLWTLGMVYLHNVCDDVEKFTGVSLGTTEQHVDARSARIIRDDEDLKKLSEWLSSHFPFSRMEELMSIGTGIIGTEKTNCHMSREVGLLGIKKIIGSNFESVKFKRDSRVITLAIANSSIKIHDNIVPINPETLFQRMCIIKQSDEELQQYLEYELAPFPMSLFSEEGMRKGTKSSLYKIFSPVSPNIESSNSINVVDGGYLLHRVVWSKNQSFASICSNYIQYIQNHYGANAIIVFDGYPSDTADKSTKSVERARRSRKKNCIEINFDETMEANVSQDKFLSNEKNKFRLIAMLQKKFQEYNIAMMQAVEDADLLIIETAIQMSPSHASVFVVGEDIDLLVLLTALARPLQNVYFRKPGKGKIVEKIYSPRSLKYSDVVANNILFLHAFSGCDTTSCLYNKGKVKFFNLLQKNKSLSESIQIFKDENANSEDIICAGEEFLVALYRINNDDVTLNALRYQHFIKSIVKNKFTLASLPPTSDAARYHSLRTYHQVQLWYNKSKNAADWGWKSSKFGLTPILMMKDPAPEVLLKCISCKCKKGCGTTCSCRKAGLKCSIICATCTGISCNNIPEIIPDSDDEPPEINQFLTLQMPDDNSDDPEELEENSQEESIISDELNSSTLIDPEQPGPSMNTRSSKKSKY